MPKVALSITQTGYMILGFHELSVREYHMPFSLSGEEEDAKPMSIEECDIYLVCTRDKTRLKRFSLPYSLVGNLLSVELEVCRNGERYFLKEILDVSMQLSQFSEMPKVYQNVDRDTLVFQSKDFTYTISIAAFVKQFRKDLHDEAKNLYVEYVGQSKRGHNEDGSIADRLLHHEKILKISMDMNRSLEHREIVIILLRLEYLNWNVMMFGKLGDFDADERTEDFEFSRYQKPIPKNDVINISEALLINTFKPRYNDKFSKNLVKNNLKVLNHVRELRYSGINIEFNIENSGFKVYSDHVKPKDFHHLNRDIQNNENDKKMFYFFGSSEA